MHLTMLVIILIIIQLDNRRAIYFWASCGQIDGERCHVKALLETEVTTSFVEVNHFPHGAGAGVGAAADVSALLTVHRNLPV